MRVSAYAIGASKEMNAMDMLKSKVVTSSKKIYYKHMSSTAFSSTTNMFKSTHLIKCFKDTPKLLLLTNLVLKRIILFPF